jgi:hypothetical protein
MMYENPQIFLGTEGVHAVAEVWLDAGGALFPDITPSIDVILGAYDGIPLWIGSQPFDPKAFGPLRHATNGGKLPYTVRWVQTYYIRVNEDKNLFSGPAAALATAEIEEFNPVVTHVSPLISEFICLKPTNGYEIAARICSAYGTIKYEGHHKFPLPTPARIRELAMTKGDRTIMRNLMHMTMDHGLFRYTDEQKIAYEEALNV